MPDWDADGERLQANVLRALDAASRHARERRHVTADDMCAWHRIAMPHPPFRQRQRAHRSPAGQLDPRALRLPPVLRTRPRPAGSYVMAATVGTGGGTAPMQRFILQQILLRTRGP